MKFMEFPRKYYLRNNLQRRQMCGEYLNNKLCMILKSPIWRATQVIGEGEPSIDKYLTREDSQTHDT